MKESKYLKPAWVISDMIEPLTYSILTGVVIGLLLYWLIKI